VLGQHRELADDAERSLLVPLPKVNFSVRSSIRSAFSTSCQ
jgi:hypothetical protein